MNDTLLGSSMQEVGSNVQRLSGDIRKLEGYLNTIGTPSDTEEYRIKIRKDVHRTTALVKSLLSSIQDLKSQDSNSGSIKLQRLEQQFLGQYSKLSQVTKSIKSKLESSSPVRNDPGSESPKKGGYDLSNVQMDEQNLIQYENHPPLREEEEEPSMRQSQTFIPQFDAHLDEMEQREEAIHQMADDLQDLHEMHQDLHQLVNEQGEHIEVLASNVEAAKEDVLGGVVHLDSAARKQKKYRKKMCIILMILLVMAVVLTLAIYFTSPHGKKK